VSEEATTYRNALPLKSMLLEYRLESVLGAGGFGMTYLGWDTNLEKHVAIKEYLPGELALRALDGSLVPVNTEHEFNYKWGLDRFIQEARTLAKFSHPNIVRVNRFFEANGTSYMVMDYEAGESLYQNLKRAPMPSEAALKNIVMPILDGLQAVHQAGFLHRDIKPSNVFIRENGTPVLLDFGSARLATGSISKSLTAIVSPGYAPLEQYTRDGNQGPWSDIYALSGVIYRAVTGENPPDAVKRMKADTVPQTLTAARTRYSERFLKAIEWGMMIDEQIRPQNVADWRELFSGRMPMSAFNRGADNAVAPTQRATDTPPTVPVTAANAAARKNPTGAPTAMQSVAGSRVLTPKRWRWLRRGAFLLILAIAVSVFFKQRTMERELQKQAAAQAQASLPAADFERQVTQRFEAADTNRSGDLSRDELTKRFPSYASRFDEIDVNRDGVVSLDELGKFMQNEGLTGEINQAQRAQTPAATPQAETAVALTPQSAPAALVTDSSRAAASSGGASGVQISTALQKEFDTADRDGNGYLTPDEVRGRFPFIAKNFDKVDTDHDGRISPVELWQMRRKQQAATRRP
jgi:serine/threonine protein kinase/Ca2+-binding EF-hand superfamily protein